MRHFGEFFETACARGRGTGQRASCCVIVAATLAHAALAQVHGEGAHGASHRRRRMAIETARSSDVTIAWTERRLECARAIPACATNVRRRTARDKHRFEPGV